MVYRLTSLWLIVLLFTFSCSKEEMDPDIDKNSSGDITVTMKMPGIHNISTYVATTEDENSVDEIDILVFKADGSNETFLYNVTGYNIEDIAEVTDGSKKTFRTTLHIEEQNTVRLVVLANARGHLPAVIPEGTPKADVLTGITLGLSGKWPTNETTPDYIPIPMWGESEIITGASPPAIVGVTMFRSLVKVDVGINFPAGSDIASGLGNTFKLASVNVVNPLNLALVAPTASNFDAGNGRAISPSVPIGATITAGSPLVYDILSTEIDSLSIISRIYLAEATAAAPGNESEAICLVIGGKFEGQAATTYYRVDFTDESSNYLPLLRNFRYKINIISVVSAGAASVETALLAPSGMTVEIVVEDEGINDIVFNNQYMLGISQDSLTIDESSLQNEISVLTTYSGGYSTTIDSDWITITSGSTGEAGEATYLVFLAEENIGDTRTGIITLTAGALTKTIEVAQPGLARFPNSYIVEPGNSVQIPLYKVYGVWMQELSTDLSDQVTSAGIVWQDAQSLISSITLYDNDQGKNAHLEVTAGSLTGNAVVSVTIDGAVRWSWHIWVTDYDPDNGGTTHDYNGMTWMDRNLGATTNTVATLNTNGYLFQWGRKDPFPGSFSVSSSGGNRTIYDAGNNTTSISLEAAPVSLGTAISSPLSFYWGAGTASNSNWLSPSRSDLWNSAGENKTIYDPCPAGWRLPPWSDTSPWSVFTTTNFTWGNTGRTYNSIAYYPAAGFRQASSGAMFNVGNYGTYWTASEGTVTSGYYMTFNNVSLNTDGNTLKTNGMSVRCVRE